MENEFGQPVGPPLADWSSRLFPQPSPILGRGCELVGLDYSEHVDALTEIFVTQTEPQQWTYLSYGPFEDEDAFRTWLRSVAPKPDEPPGRDPQFYVLRKVPGAGNGEASVSTWLGMLSFMRIAPVHGVIEIGHIHFSSKAQRTTLATEANFLLLRRAFDELGYRRVEWKCDALNHRSRRAAERLGFVFEGVFRNATVYKGRSRDTAWYSIIDRDWPAVKQSIENWLASDNFDAEGNQLKRLEDFR